MTLLLCTSVAEAQIQVQAPKQVAVGENFKIEYTITNAEVKNFRGGSVPSDGFEFIAGPYTSQSSYVNMVNGHVTQTSSITYTYTYYAQKNGTYTISPAHAKINGKDVASQSIKITVSGTAQQNRGANQRNQPSQRQQAARVNPRGSAISGNDLFITVTANKKRVHEQEPVLLTYKVFTQVELSQLEGKMPDLNGFHTQEIPLPQQKSFHLENVNGKPYRCVTWSQYVMFPQMTGKLEIPSITFKGIVVQENPNIDPFEAFFNGGSSYVEVKKDIKAPAIQIQVDPLPDKPADFSGGVGQFSVSASVDKKTVRAGDPINLCLKVSGTGNLKLIKQPEFELPKDFEKYDPKVTDKTQLSAQGVSGSMIYDILIVPRHQGKYEIPAIKLTYFDTATSAYKTVSTQPIAIEVSKGTGKSGDVADYSKDADTDIYPIYEAGLTLSKPHDYFFGSTRYVIMNAIVFIVFLALIIIFRKRAMERANVTMMRGKKANSVATKRLKKATKLMKAGKTGEFYDEVMRATWGYVADKFSIPVSDLSRDTVTEKLQQRNVDQQVIDSLLEAIDECEFERYAPGDAAGNMQKTYDSAATAITNINNVMRHIRTIAIILVMALTPASAALAADAAKQPADVMTQANVDYSKGNYQSAINGYNTVLKENVSADVYYNLGNAYFRSDDITKAIISYERAKLLAPGNKDIEHNLRVARLKTVDKLMPADRMFFVEWYQALRNMNTPDGWANMAFVSLVVALLLFLVYLFVDHAVVQRLSFYMAIVLIVVFIFGNLFAWQLKDYAENTMAGVITTNEVTVKKTPTAQSADVCVIHEGTHVDIIDSALKDWTAVTLPDGREGWIPAKSLEKI